MFAILDVCVIIPLYSTWVNAFQNLSVRVAPPPPHTHIYIYICAIPYISYTIDLSKQYDVPLQRQRQRSSHYFHLQHPSHRQTGRCPKNYIDGREKRVEVWVRWGSNVCNKDKEIRMLSLDVHDDYSIRPLVSLLE